MALQLNLEKSAQVLRLDLEKAGIISLPEAEVAFNIDVSGSFREDHESGETNTLLTRLVPWSMVFDPDKKIDVFTFSDGEGHTYYVGEANEYNYPDYIRKHVIEKVPGWGEGTDFSHVLRKNIKHMGWQNRPDEERVLLPKQEERKSGWFSRLFGWGSQARPQSSVISLRQREPTEGKTALVVTVTDGENYDSSATLEVLRNARENAYRIFFLFLGVERLGRRFEFLTRIDEELVNVGFVRVSDVCKFVRLADEELNKALLVPKLIGWLKVA